MKTRLRYAAAIFLATALSAPASRAEDMDELRTLHDTTINLVNLLVEQGLISREKADAIIQKAKVVPLQSGNEEAERTPGMTAEGGLAANSSGAAGAGASSAAQGSKSAGGSPSASDVLNLLVDQGVISRDKANSLLEEAQRNAEAEAAREPTAPPTPLPALTVPGSAEGTASESELNAARAAGTVAGPRGAPTEGAASGASPAAMASGAVAAPVAAAATEGAAPVDGGATTAAAAATNATSAGTAGSAANAASAPAGTSTSAGANAMSTGTAGPASNTASAPAGTSTATAGSAAPPPGAASAPAATAEPNGTVHVQYVPEAVKRQILEQVRQDVLAQAKKERWGDPGALPDWIYRISWSGDFRLRGETDLFPTDGAPNATPAVVDFNTPYYYGMNDTTSTSSRLRILARFGLEARVSDTISAGLRVATGGAGGGSNPGTENQTLGNYDTRFAIGLDRAYIRYKPWNWLSLTGGRLGNPFFVSSDMIWSETLSLEGIETKFTHDFSDDLDGILIAGIFPIQQRDNEIISAPGVGTENKWMFGYQTGLDWRFEPRDDLKTAVAFYDYRHVEGIAATDVNNIDQYDWSSAGFRQKGNQTFDIHALADVQQQGNVVPTYIGLVSKFRELNLSTSVDLGDFAPTHIIVRGDFVRNLGFHAQDIENRTGITDPEVLTARVAGYQAKVIVGREKPSNRGEWQVYTGYRHLDRDAVLDAYNDQDFHLGGTNAKGYFIGGRYGLAKDTTVHLRWLSADQVSGPQLAIDVLQLDLTTSF